MAVVVDIKGVSIAVVVEVIDLFKKAAEFVGALDKAIAVDIGLNEFVFLSGGDLAVSAKIRNIDFFVGELFDELSLGDAHPAYLFVQGLRDL